MSKCISVRGEYSEHEYTGKDPTCDYCGQISEMIAAAQLQTMRAALVAIQKLHKLCKTFTGKEVCNVCNTETGKPIKYPCKTRKLTDEALEDQ